MHVFTYGSLMYPPVWERVVSGRYPGRSGAVRGFARRRVAGEVYPGLIRATPTSAVEGIVYLDVSAADLAALDRFEGDAYERVLVTVELGGGESVEAWSYLFRDLSRLEEAVWEPARFEGPDLAHFLATYCRERGAG